MGTDLPSPNKLRFYLICISLIITISCLNPGTDAHNISPRCNGTATGCRIAEDEAAEFLMESEISRRILATQKKVVSYGSQNPKKPYCDADTYGSCIGPASKNYNKRPCNYQNACNRPGS